MERRLYKCKECGREVVILSKGLCPGCRSRQLPKKQVKPIRARPKKKEKSYSSFYAECLGILSERRMSDFSGKHIPIPSVCNVCHILPKRRYKSVAEDMDNIIFLTDEEHTRYDYLLDTLDLDTMKKESPLLYFLTLTRFQSLRLSGKVKETGKLFDRLCEVYDFENKEPF